MFQIITVGRMCGYRATPTRNDKMLTQKGLTNQVSCIIIQSERKRKELKKMEIFTDIKNRIIVYLVNHTHLYAPTIWAVMEKMSVSEAKHFVSMKEKEG